MAPDPQAHRGRSSTSYKDKQIAMNLHRERHEWLSFLEPRRLPRGSGKGAAPGRRYRHAPEEREGEGSWVWGLSGMSRAHGEDEDGEVQIQPLRASGCIT